MRILRRAARDADIPTSSMADIAFLLIIFFMVTAVFSATKGLELTLPDRNDSDPDPDPAVLIHVYPSRLVVDCQAVGMDQILPYLEPKLGRNPALPVVLYADPQVEYREVVSVYDVLAGSRVQHVSVPTRSEVSEYAELFGGDLFEARCRE